MNGTRTSLLSLVLATACGTAQLPARDKARTQEAVCTPTDNQSFLQATQWLDEDWAFGAGESVTAQAAYDLAINDAMRTIEIKIRSETAVVDSETVAGGTSTRLTRSEEDVRVLVEQRRAGCSRERSCQTPDGRVRVWARCSRNTVMEQDLRKASARLVRALPAQAAIMVLPPTDDGDHFTHLAYEAQGILQHRLQPPLLAPTQKLVVMSEGMTTDPTKLWRQYGVTHFVTGSTSSPTGRRAEFRLYLQNAATGEILPQSLSRFEVDLEPQERDKLERKGALFPQKAAMELVGMVGDRRGIELRLSATQFREGELAEFSLRLAEPGYVYVFSVYENGKASLLLPSAPSPGNRLEAGRWYTFPDEAWKKGGYVLKVCPIPGDKVNRERIKAFATTKPLDLPLDRYTLSGLADLREGPKGQIAEINQRIDELQRAGAGVSTAVAAYDIVAVEALNTGCPKR
jgi:hypothetical protein